MPMKITRTGHFDQASRYGEIIDKHYTVKCPHCGVPSGLSAVSLPQWDLLVRYKPPKVGVGYRCDACQQPVFLRFFVDYDLHNGWITLKEPYEEVERPQETYEFNHLPNDVAADFREALVSYSNSCFNAFASMCRRTIQSGCTALGADGKDKVLKQIEDLKTVAQVDDETFEVLKTIVIAGHDGAHPHLPSLSPERAEVLLELMKDVLYQLFVRKKKIEETAAKRAAAIQNKKV
jgi:hypothetical protein